MERNALCRPVGGAVMMVALIGCSSQSPFTQARFDEPQLDGEHTRIALRESTVKNAAQDELPVLTEASLLDDYQRYAAMANPGLEAMFQDWQAALERVPQVRSLPDPRFTYGYYLGEVETRVGPMQHSLSVAQTFPWFGKLQNHEDAAARSANAAFERLEAARLALFLRVERAFNELYYLKRSIEITNENIELLQQFERVAQSRYRVAAAGHPDIIRIQVELGTMEDRLQQLRQMRSPFAARLNAALNRDAGAEVPWPKQVSDHVVTVPHEQLWTTLQERNPELLALQEDIESERIGAEIAKKDGYPDFTLGLAYTVIDARGVPGLSEDGDDAILGTVSVNVPIWREKYDAGIREAVARRLAAAGRRGEAVNRLASELQEALYEHDDARRRIDLYRDTLIPKATESLQASLGSFEQGQSDFLDLIDTERTLLEFQLALERALVDRATSHAWVERLIGTNLSNLANESEESTP